MNIDHIERARRSWPHLAKRASQNLPPCTYKEICGEIGLHWRAARYFLGVIQRHCRANGLPPLQFLAVNAASRLPGRGCVGSPRTDAAQQEALRMIYAYPWPADAPF
jgi:hypothetical protein